MKLRELINTFYNDSSFILQITKFGITKEYVITIISHEYHAKNTLIRVQSDGESYIEKFGKSDLYTWAWHTVKYTTQPKDNMLLFVMGELA